MKLSILAGLIRKCSVCSVITKDRSEDPAPGEMIINVGNTAFYKCGSIPEVHGDEQIIALLSLNQKQADKIMFTEETYLHIQDIQGFDISDGAFAYEKDTDETPIQISYKSKDYTSVRTSDGETIFFDKKYLAPLREEMKSAYFTLKTRVYDNGYSMYQYIVAKDGMRTLAVIMPACVSTEEYVDDLKTFTQECETQWHIEENRRQSCRKALENQ